MHVGLNTAVLFHNNLSFLSFIQKRHKADSVVNKKECQGVEISPFPVMFFIRTQRTYYSSHSQRCEMNFFAEFLLIHFLFCSLSSLTAVLRNGAWEIVHWEKVRTHYVPPYTSSSASEHTFFYLSAQIICLCCCVSEKPDTYSVHTYWL